MADGTPHPAIVRGVQKVWGFYRDSEVDDVAKAVAAELRRDGWMRTYKERRDAS